MRNLPSSRDIWEGMDFTEALKQAKRRCRITVTIVFVVCSILSGYIFFDGYRLSGIPAADYYFAAAIGLGSSLASCLSALSCISDRSNQPPPGQIICSRIAPFAGVLTWLLTVLLVFPNPVLEAPPWKLLLGRPYVLIGVVLITSVLSQLIGARVYVGFHVLRMKFDRRYRQMVDRISKAVESRH